MVSRLLQGFRRARDPPHCTQISPLPGVPAGAAGIRSRATAARDVASAQAPTSDVTVRASSLRSRKGAEHATYQQGGASRSGWRAASALVVAAARRGIAVPDSGTGRSRRIAAQSRTTGRCARGRDEQLRTGMEADEVHRHQPVRACNFARNSLDQAAGVDEVLAELQ